MEKLHQCSFFDDEIKTSIFYPTLHDAMLHILEMHPDRGELEKVHFDSNIVIIFYISLTTTISCQGSKKSMLISICVVMFAGYKHKLRSHSERQYNCVRKRRLWAKSPAEINILSVWPLTVLRRMHYFSLQQHIFIITMFTGDLVAVSEFIVFVV